MPREPITNRDIPENVQQEFYLLSKILTSNVLQNYRYKTKLNEVIVNIERNLQLAYLKGKTAGISQATQKLQSTIESIR